MNKSAYLLGIATLAMIGVSHASPVALTAVSEYHNDTSWQDVKGTSYTWNDANGNGKIDVGEQVTFTVDMGKQYWGKHLFDGLKFWVDNSSSANLFTGTGEWDFSTAASRADVGGAYDYKPWTGGDKFFSFNYTFANAGTFDLTASVMCSADLSTLVTDGAYDAPTAADWNAWNENEHGPGAPVVHQGETEKYKLQVYAAVPEPGTLALFFLGLSGLVVMGYSRKKKLS